MCQQVVYFIHNYYSRSHDIHSYYFRSHDIHSYYSRSHDMNFFIAGDYNISDNSNCCITSIHSGIFHSTMFC